MTTGINGLSGADDGEPTPFIIGECEGGNAAVLAQFSCLYTFGDKAGSKLSKAQQLGVETLDEKQFQMLLEGT